MNAFDRFQLARLHAIRREFPGAKPVSLANGPCSWHGHELRFWLPPITDDDCSSGTVATLIVHVEGQFGETKDEYIVDLARRAARYELVRKLRDADANRRELLKQIRELEQ